MKWVTRARPKTDRIACPWLIRRFIDPDAEIIYVAPEQVLATAAELDGRSFDAPGADFTHRDGKCTFEVLIDEYGPRRRSGVGPPRSHRSRCRHLRRPPH